MPDHQIILGIDPGTRITGYGLIRKMAHTYEPIDFGCIRPPADLPLHERYKIIFDGVEKIIGQYQPTAIAVESQFVMKNVLSALKLGMAKGMILLAAARHKIPLFEYAPKRAKQAVVGTGGASKLQVQKMIQTLLRLPKLPQPEDAADALALAICCAHELDRGNILCTNPSQANLKKKIPSKRLLKREGLLIDSPSL
ncbi:MAG: crossover junction endodeoxyribonuclease RuvC [Chlamydiales bacterium]|nr:crossover junction endodeoxyribonuclease RuvC [Chlamydiales bacterium]